MREHLLHTERLKRIQGAINLQEPRKPRHLIENYKKEVTEMEKKNEIQRGNRLLLQKMLKIDLHPSSLNPKRLQESAAQSASKGSLNQSVRVQELTKILSQNKLFLKKLQNTQANYSALKWEQQHRKAYLAEQMRVNSCRFSKNPYFLHSLLSLIHI